MPKRRTLTPGASPLHHFGSEVRRAREAAAMTLTELRDGAVRQLDREQDRVRADRA